jgi:hypothetical protein
MRSRALRRLAANRYSPNVPRVLAAACAVGLVALTLTLGSLRHPPTAVSSLPQPPLSHTAAPPVAIAPPALPSSRDRRRETRTRGTARPDKIVAKEAVRLAGVVHPEAPTRTEPVQAPVESKRPRPHSGEPSPRQPSPKPSPPPVTTLPPTPVTTPPATASPIESPPAATPPASTVPVAAPPIIVETSTLETRPGNGWGDRNHAHTGPPNRSK